MIIKNQERNFALLIFYRLILFYFFILILAIIR